MPGRRVTAIFSSRSGMPAWAHSCRSTVPLCSACSPATLLSTASPWSCCLCCVTVKFRRPWSSACCLLLGNAYHMYPEQCPCFLNSGFSLAIKKSLCWGGEKTNKRFVVRMELFEVHFTSALAWPPYTVFVLVCSNEEITGQGEVDQGHPGYRNTFSSSGASTWIN